MPEQPFVHAKVYIIDGKEIFIGSANLTWGGFRKNIEVVAKFANPLICAEMRKEIWKVLASSQVLNLEAMGSILYTEPPN